MNWPADEKVLYLESINFAYAAGCKRSIKFPLLLLFFVLFLHHFTIYDKTFKNVDIASAEMMLEVCYNHLFELFLQTVFIGIMLVVSIVLYNRYLEGGYIVITDKHIIVDLRNFTRSTILLLDIEEIQVLKYEKKLYSLHFIAKKKKCKIYCYQFDLEKILHVLKSEISCSSLVEIQK